MNKRGLSAIVATVIIIMITFAAVTIIWAAILPMFSDFGIDVSDARVEVVSSSGYTVYDAAENKLQVQVKRSTGDDEEVKQIKIVVNFEGNTISELEDAPAPNNEKIYVFKIPEGYGEPTSVTVVPIFTKGFSVKEGRASADVDFREGDLFGVDTDDILGGGDCKIDSKKICLGSSVGVCVPGNQTCVDIDGLGFWGEECEGSVSASIEVCDAEELDENCNGVSNEECSCVNYETRECGPNNDDGICEFGTQTCENGVWLDECEDSVLPSDSEVCDVEELDENCDGVSNENCECVSGVDEECGTDLGICVKGVMSCTDGVLSEVCQGEVSSGTEVCDAEELDENCDGTGNENCECIDGSTKNCGPETNVGVCEFGTQTCGSGSWSEICVGAVSSITEDCNNNLDDDCDGTVNEDCPTCYDEIQNQGELGVDCGGPCAEVCPVLIPVSSCTIIDQSGNYYLTKDLITTDADCIKISADDVNFDGRGYTIRTSVTSKDAVYIYRSSSNRNSNVNVSNLNMVMGGYNTKGVYARYTDYFKIENCTFDLIYTTSSGVRGVYVESSNHGEILDNEFTSYPDTGVQNYGISISGEFTSDYNLVEDNSFDNFWIGIHIAAGSYNYITENDISDSRYRGIFVADGNNNFISNRICSSLSLNDIYFSAANDCFSCIFDDNTCNQAKTTCVGACVSGC